MKATALKHGVRINATVHRRDVPPGRVPVVFFNHDGSVHAEVDVSAKIIKMIGTIAERAGSTREEMLAILMGVYLRRCNALGHAPVYSETEV